MSAHQTILNERFKQLRQTKAGLRQWGNQLFTSLKTAEQESGAATATATEAETAVAGAGGEPLGSNEQADTAERQGGGKATRTDPTATGEEENLRAEAAPVVTSVDEP